VFTDLVLGKLFFYLDKFLKAFWACKKSFENHYLNIFLEIVVEKFFRGNFR